MRSMISLRDRFATSSPVSVAPESFSPRVCTSSTSVRNRATACSKILGHGERSPPGDGISGKTFSRRELRRAKQPLPVRTLIGHADVRLRLERVPPMRDRRLLGIPIQLFVALAQEPKSVLVEPHPNVQPMLFDATRRTTARGAFPSEPPAELIHGDVVAVRMLRTRQLERCRDGRAASADDGHFDALATRHRVLLSLACVATSTELDAARSFANEWAERRRLLVRSALSKVRQMRADVSMLRTNGNALTPFAAFDRPSRQTNNKYIVGGFHELQSVY